MELLILTVKFWTRNNSNGLFNIQVLNLLHAHRYTDYALSPALLVAEII